MDTRELYMCSVVRDDPIHYTFSLFTMFWEITRIEDTGYVFCQLIT